MRSKPLFVVAFAAMLSLAGCIGADLAEDSVGGGLAMYLFDAYDAPDSMTNSSDDEMFDVDMIAGDDPIPFANLSVRITVDYGMPMTCVQAGTGFGDESCVYYVDNSKGSSDEAWELSESIRVVENGENLCSGSCDIDLTLVYDDSVLTQKNFYIG